MRRSHRLKTYLLAFALVLTVPMLVGTGLAIWRFSGSERLRLMSMAADAGQDIGIRVDREISTRVAILQGLAVAPTIYDDEEAFSREARQLAAKTGVHIALFDATGQQLVNTRVAAGQALPKTSDPDLIREVVGQGKAVYAANLFLGRITNAEQVQVAVPVMRDGKVYRILGASILASSLTDLVSEDLSRPFHATLLDRGGIIIARSQDAGKFVGKAFSGFAEKFAGDEGTVWLATAQGQPTFAYYRRHSLSGWLIVAEIPEAALDGPLYRSLEILAGVIAVLVAFALISAWLIGRRLTLAHRSLIDAAAAMGDGRVPTSEPTALHEANLVAGALADASRAVLLHAAKLTDANQNLERRVRQRTEELMYRTNEIESKNALIETTLDTMNQGLIVTDADGRVPICNLQARLLLGLPDSLVERHPLFEEIASHGADQAVPDIDATEPAPSLLPHPESAALRFEQIRPNGQILEVRTAAIPRAGGFVQTFSDVTEERQKRVLLEQARVAAEKANTAKSDFLANMSHEMHTLLNAVLGYSDIVLSRPLLDGDIERSVSRIRGAGTALLTLVNEVLELGKIEAGVIDIRNEPFALADLVEQTVSIIRPAAERKNLSVDVSLRVSMVGLRLGDRDRLRQVLLNLLGNAVKFTHSGRIELSIDNGVKDGTVRFAVADTGIGISESDQDKLFQRFQQLDPSINRRFGGTGLGLAISKHLVEQMGGAIEVESTVGEGSVFWFDVPLEQVKTGSTPSSLTGMDPMDISRILVAEDVVINQELARELLESAGYAVDVVGTGRAAVEAVMTGRYDLVLMDVSMPEMDGMTATRRIRQGPPETSGVPIIACTAHVLPEQIEAIKEAGFDLYLFKPLQHRQLFSAIERMLEKANERGPGSADGEPWGGVAALVNLLGPVAVLSALGAFLEDLRGLELGDSPARSDHSRLAARAHATIATASLLGFTALSAACRDLEDACRSNSGVYEAANRLSILARGTVGEVQSLQNTLEEKRKSGDTDDSTRTH